jgi:hypothetical protein
MAGTTGLEPATSAVTGQRSNQLNYVPREGMDIWWAVTDLNRGPSRCKRDALTAELTAQMNFGIVTESVQKVVAPRATRSGKCPFFCELLRGFSHPDFTILKRKLSLKLPLFQNEQKVNLSD